MKLSKLEPGTWHYISNNDVAPKEILSTWSIVGDVREDVLKLDILDAREARVGISNSFKLKQCDMDESSSQSWPNLHETKRPEDNTRFRPMIQLRWFMLCKIIKINVRNWMTLGETWLRDPSNGRSTEYLYGQLHLTKISPMKSHSRCRSRRIKKQWDKPYFLERKMAAHWVVTDYDPRQTTATSKVQWLIHKKAANKESPCKRFRIFWHPKSHFTQGTYKKVHT